MGFLQGRQRIAAGKDKIVDAGGAQRLGGDIFQCFANTWNIRVWLRQEPVAGLGVIGHRAQGLINFVRNAASQFTDSCQARYVQQSSLQA